MNIIPLESTESASASTEATAGRRAFRLALDRWLLGLARASVQGGALTTKAFIGAAAAHGAGLPVPALGWRQAIAAFVFGFGYHFIGYLSEHRIAEPEK